MDATDPRIREQHRQPAPQTQPAPVQARRDRPVILYLLLSAVLALQVYGRFFGGEQSGTVLSAQAVGQGARIAFARTHAEALRQAADEIERGDDLPDVMKRTAERWAQARSDAFDRLAVPALDRIIPPDTEKPSASQRTRYAEFLRQIASAEDEVK